jgi:hypothetical protein
LSIGVRASVRVIGGRLSRDLIRQLAGDFIESGRDCTDGTLYLWRYHYANLVVHLLSRSDYQSI